MPGSEEESVLLQHFVDAQDQPVVGSDVPDETVYERAIVQLKDGVLPSYDELWFIFPRVIEDAEASRKRLARQYSIKSYKEAKAYYFDNVLYGNLIDAIDAVRAGQGFDLDDGFGRGARKFKPWFRECLTLFSEIEADFDEPNETVFRDSLDEFFGGDPDEDVIDLVYDFVDHPEMMSEFGTVTSLDEDEDEDLVVEEDPMDLEIEEPEYELKGFLASRVDKGVLKYQADWDWPVPDLTFYPATNFRNASPLLEEFHSRHPDQPGPSMRLGEWLAAYQRGTIADSHEDDNLALVAAQDSSATSSSVAAKMPSKVMKTKKGKKL